MKSEWFYDSYIKGFDWHNKPFLHDVDYIKYLIYKFIYKNNCCDIDEILNYINSYYEQGNIKLGKVKKLIEERFEHHKNKIVLDDEYNDFVDREEKMLNLIKKANTSDKTFSSIDYVKKNIYSKDIDFLDLLSSIFDAIDSDSWDHYDYALYQFNKIYEGNVQRYQEFVNYINNLNSDFSDCDFVGYIRNSNMKDLLLHSGIYRISDIKNMPYKNSYALLSMFEEDLKPLFSLFSNSYEYVYKLELNELYSNMKEDRKEVLIQRNNYYLNQFKTLEEVGNEFNCTRERIRQIEKNAKEVLKHDYYMFELYARDLYKKLSNEKFLYCNVLRNFINDELTYNYVMCAIDNCDEYIKYIKEYDILIDTRKNNFDDLINNILDKYQLIIPINEYLNADLLDKKVINNYYRLLENTIYFKRGLPYKTLYSIIVSDFFPNGYKIGGQNSDYKLLVYKMKEKYGDNTNIAEERSITNYLMRANFCLIDIGTYKNREKCIELPNNLVDKIIDYVVSNESIVYYSSIYTKFKNELKSLGVNNEFYLKGLIDEFLPNQCTSKRNYILTDGSVSNSLDGVVKYMRSFDGLFTRKDLKKRFPGVKEYTINNVIYSEANNGLLWLSKSRFIYADKLDIDSKLINYLDEFIINLFYTMNVRNLCIGKIYGKLSILNGNIIKRIYPVDDSFGFFSLIKYLYPNKYFYYRPLISLDKDDSLKTSKVIEDHLYTLDFFNHKDLINYLEKMDLGTIPDYGQFMISLSDDYVQIDRDSMLKKEELNLSDKEIREINKILELIFNKSNVIYTNQFNGYFMMPKLSVPWNKYLLVGIIRTYLNDKYEVENTENDYRKTDFAVRRIK